MSNVALKDQKPAFTHFATSCLHPFCHMGEDMGHISWMWNWASVFPLPPTPSRPITNPCLILIKFVILLYFPLWKCSRSFIGSQYSLKTNLTWHFKHILITVNSNTKDFITNYYHLSSYLKIIGKACNLSTWSLYVGKFKWSMMQSTHLKPMTDIWHQLLSTKPNVCGGEGGLWINMGRWWYSWDDKFGWWEEVPIKLPQDVFSVYKSVLSVRLLLLEARVIFSEAEIFNFNLVFPTENLSITFPTVC